MGIIPPPITFFPLTKQVKKFHVVYDIVNLNFAIYYAHVQNYIGRKHPMHLKCLGSVRVGQEFF